jgi:hypothetical protein
MTTELHDIINTDWRRYHRGFDVEDIPQATPPYVRGYLDALYRLRDLADAKGTGPAVEQLREWLS